MSLSSAVHWWEEWQLRILVLSSLFVQWLLYLSAAMRKFAIPSWFRSIIWLAYLGSDALAVYALANLFSRQRRQDCSSGQGNSILEVVWAPVLLMHLGGQDVITAYNIEDNELWTRHVITAVSQVAVAIYVFCKSWPGGDKRLLQAAILFFVPGILKCTEKPWALKSASFNSLVSSSGPALRKRNTGKESGINSLEDYVEKTRAFVQADHCSQAQGEGNVDLEDYRIFVDLASPYHDRLGVLKSFWVLDRKQANVFLQNRLFSMFYRLYTKTNLLGSFRDSKDETCLELLSMCIRLSAISLPWAAVGLFHKSHRDAYDDNDVKVTYALFCCTAALEYFCFYTSSGYVDSPMVAVRYGALKDSLVGQYSLMGFFVRNKRHTKTMRILSFFHCKDFFYQHWSMKPCNSSFAITELVLKYLKKGWKDQIKDAESYWKFNDRRGQWTLQTNKCNQGLGCTLRRPFDESVLLWHIATDFCFYYLGTSANRQCATAQCIEDAPGEGHGCAVWCEISPHHGRAVQCREMSNYMMYLLFVNPEMLLSGTRRNLLMTANAELEEILEDDDPSLKKFLKGEKPLLMEIVKCDKPFLTFFTGKKPLLKEIERALMQRIIAKVQPTENREHVVEHMGSPPDAETDATTQEGFIRDAWKISEALLALGDEKMWEVIEGVWVEMLCFSASRCRGYLHAKSLGTGPELLTYVWLLLSQMGMETLPERLQRMELSSGGGNTGATPSTSQTSASEDPPPFRRSMPHEAAAAGASTPRPQEILPAE